jgi:hypothetical protein
MQLITILKKFHVSFGPGDSKAETNVKFFALEPPSKRTSSFRQRISEVDTPDPDQAAI